MERTPKRRLVKGLVVVALLAVVGLGVVRHPGPAQRVAADPEDYTYTAEPLGGGSDQYALYVYPPRDDQDSPDYAAYKAANDARIAEWLAAPATAPPVNDRTVQVTFRRPLSPEELAAVAVGHLAVGQHVLCGRSDGGEASFSHGAGAVDPQRLGVPLTDPACQSAPEGCGQVTYTGVLQVAGRVTGGGLATLAALRDHPEVYLADATGLVAEDHFRSTAPGSGASVTMVSLPNAIWAPAGVTCP